MQNRETGPAQSSKRKRKGTNNWKKKYREKTGTLKKTQSRKVLRSKYL